MAEHPPQPGQASVAVPATRRRTRSRPVKPGRMPVSEFAFDRAGAGSPFGDDLMLPFPADRLDYKHAAADIGEHAAADIGEHAAADAGEHAALESDAGPSGGSTSA